MWKKLSILFGLVAIPAMVWAADSETITTDRGPGTRVFKKSVAWTASAIAQKADINVSVDGLVYHVVTIPGATAPAANWDLTVEDSDGVDIMAGETQNRSGTVAEQAEPLFGTNYNPRMVVDGLTLKFTELATADAEGVVNIYYKK